MLEHELRELDPRARRQGPANFPRDNSGVHVVAPRTPRLFGPMPKQQVVVGGGKVFDFRGGAMQETRQPAAGGFFVR